MEMLYGEEAMRRLAEARVAIFGLGGVGGYVAEALVRSGVGALDLIDSDRVSLSNLNRQILALEDNVGMLKTDAAERRIRSINPQCMRFSTSRKTERGFLLQITAILRMLSIP